MQNVTNILQKIAGGGEWGGDETGNFFDVSWRVIDARLQEILKSQYVCGCVCLCVCVCMCV